MKADTIQTNFTSGEVSPQMLGRTDSAKYANGAAMLRNFIVRPQGGIIRRSGTLFIERTVNDNYVRLIPFTISNTNAYVIEFGDTYIRFYTNLGIVIDPNTSNPLQITTPYVYTDLDSLYYTQSADVMFITSPNYQTQVLTRLSNENWTLVPYVAEDGPYLDVDTTGNRAQVKLTSDITTMVAYGNAGGPTPDVTTITSTTNIFGGGDVGKCVLLDRNKQTTGFYIIDSYISATSVTGHPVNVVGTGGTYNNSTGQVTVNSATLTFSVADVGSVILSQAGYCLITGFINSTTVSVTLLTKVSHPSGPPLTVTTVIGGSSGTFSSGSVGMYLEYNIDGIFYLSKILTYISANVVKVQILPQIFTNAGLYDVTIPSGSAGSSVTCTSSFTGAFTQSDVGKYLRDSVNQRWVLITKIINSSSVSGTIQNIFGYTYPSLVMIPSDDRVITCTIGFTNGILLSTDVGRQIRFQFASQFRSFTITTVTSSTAASGVLSDFIPYDLISAANNYNNGWSDNFWMGAWSASTGFPALCCFYLQRLVFANTVRQPSTIWMTQPADYYNMAPTDESGQVLGSSAINLTLTTGSADPITWMKSTQVLLCGTFSTEYEISAVGGILTPTSITSAAQSFFGSVAPTIAHRIGVATVFLERGGNKLREMLYQFQFDAFNSKDISIISEHILRIRQGAKIMTHQVSPISIFWIVCNNGDLVSCTYDRDQEVVAFAPHTIAGGQVESAATVPYGQTDITYISVVRGTNRFIEVMQPLFDSDTGNDLNNLCFLDCATVYGGAPATVISGLDYVEGRTVYAMADSVFVGPFTVTGGSITLTVAASTVYVGFLYNSIFGSLSPDSSSQVGTSQGKRRKISELSVRVKDAMPFKHGKSLDTLALIDSDNFGTDLNSDGSSGSIISGDIRFSLDDDWNSRAQYFIVQDQPFPLTVLSVMPILFANE